MSHPDTAMSAISASSDESGSLPLSAKRRQILFSISAVATTAVLASCAPSAAPVAASAGPSDLETLASVAYEILPYPELPAALYVKAAQRILDARDPTVAQGLAQLREPGHNRAWKDLPEPQRVAMLKELEESPFFHVARAHTLQVLLRDPLTYAVVGYGGPSIPYGGYLIRGFNNISWLPAPAGPSRRTRS